MIFSVVSTGKMADCQSRFNKRGIVRGQKRKCIRQTERPLGWGIGSWEIKNSDSETGEENAAAQPEACDWKQAWVIIEARGCTCSRKQVCPLYFCVHVDRGSSWFLLISRWLTLDIRWSYICIPPRPCDFLHWVTRPTSAGKYTYIMASFNDVDSALSSASEQWSGNFLCHSSHGLISTTQAAPHVAT